jgi:hypothetical protein
MNTQYEAVLKFLRNEDFAEAADWLDVVQRSPGFLQWWGALELVAKIALTVAAIVLLGWLWERSQLWWLERQRTSLSNSSGTAPRRPRTFGLVGKWIRILATQPQSGRSGGAETLGTLVARRYDWAGSVFGLLRNAALMIGLLFTFIGLGLTLHQLSGALDLDQNVANVNEALRGVRSALPGLSTAFGSSVFGVLVALGIWIVDTLMQMLRNDIEAELKSRSVAWLEAHFSPLTAEKGFEQLVVELSTLNRLMTNAAAAATDDAKNHDFIRETLGSLAEASNTLNSSTDRLAKAADNLLFVVNRNLDVEKGQNEAAMAAREARGRNAENPGRPHPGSPGSWRGVRGGGHPAQRHSV